MDDDKLSSRLEGLAEWQRPTLSRIRLDQTAGTKSGSINDGTSSASVTG